MELDLAFDDMIFCLMFKTSPILLKLEYGLTGKKNELNGKMINISSVIQAIFRLVLI